MADAPDSKSGRGNPVRVQVPPPAPQNQVLTGVVPPMIRHQTIGMIEIQL
jgi:hypothetical protein